MGALVAAVTKGEASQYLVGGGIGLAVLVALRLIVAILRVFIGPSEDRVRSLEKRLRRRERAIEVLVRELRKHDLDIPREVFAEDDSD